MVNLILKIRDGNQTNRLDETVTAAPVMRMTAGTRPAVTAATPAARTRTNMLPPRVSSTVKKPGLTSTKPGLTSNVKKSVLREVKEVDPDEVTDEMMDMAYARWVLYCCNY